MAKYSFSEYQVYSEIQKKIDQKNYLQDEIDNQRQVLESVVESAKTFHKEHEQLTQAELRKSVNEYNYETFSSIVEPDLEHFYRYKTIMYMKQKKIDIKKYIEQYLDEYDFEHLKECKRITQYTASMEKNIYALIDNLLCEFGKIDYCTSGEFNNLHSKVKRGILNKSDIDLITKYMKMAIFEISIDPKKDYWNELKKAKPKNSVNGIQIEMEPLVNAFIQNIDKIFCNEEKKKIADEEEVNKSNESSEMKEKIAQASAVLRNPVKANDMHSTILPTKKSYSATNEKEKALSLTTRVVYRKRKIHVRNFVENPFISENKQNNMMIYIHNILKTISDYNDDEAANTLCYIYNIAEFCRDTQKKIDNKEIPVNERAYYTRVMQILKEALGSLFNNDNFDLGVHAIDIKGLMAKRVGTLTSLLYIGGMLDQFNNSYNEMLESRGAGFLGEHIEDICVKLDNNKDMSEEALIVMSAFYCNRMAKLIECYLRPVYILDRKDFFKKLYENPDITLDDLGYTDEELKSYMARYDFLQDIFYNQHYKKYCVAREKYGNSKKTKKYSDDLIKHIMKRYAEPYKEKYGDMFEEMITVVPNSAIKDSLYRLKGFSSASLIYIALTEQNKSIINWGIVRRDKNQDPNKVLFAFDIHRANLPVFVHLKLDEVIEIVKDITGKCEVPYYKGGSDFDKTEYSKSENGHVRYKTKMSIPILYPISKKNRKLLIQCAEAENKKYEETANIKYRSDDNKFFNHLAWLQDPKNVPDHIKAIPDRVCNLEKLKQTLSAPSGGHENR